MNPVTLEDVLMLARRANNNGQKDERNLLLMVAGIIEDDPRITRSLYGDETLDWLLGIDGPFGVGFSRSLRVTRGI